MMITNKLKVEREKADISLAALSKITGISKSTLQRYETGTTKKIPMEAISSIEKALKLTPGYLMGWSENSQTENESEKDELAEYLEELRTRPEMKMLFSLAKDATKEDVEKAVKIIETLLGKE